MGRNLHLVPSHPLQLLKSRIEQFFQAESGGFSVFDSLHPRVTVEQNFDHLLVPPSHPSRKLTDTVSTEQTPPACRAASVSASLLRCLLCLPSPCQFYFDSQHCLRTHTSAHQTQVSPRQAGAEAEGSGELR